MKKLMMAALLIGSSAMAETYTCDLSLKRMNPDPTKYQFTSQFNQSIKVNLAKNAKGKTEGTVIGVLASFDSGEAGLPYILRMYHYEGQAEGVKSKDLVLKWDLDEKIKPATQNEEETTTRGVLFSATSIRGDIGQRVMNLRNLDENSDLMIFCKLTHK